MMSAIGRCRRRRKLTTGSVTAPRVIRDCLSGGRATAVGILPGFRSSISPQGAILVSGISLARAVVKRDSASD